MNKRQQLIDWIENQPVKTKKLATRYYNDCITSEGIDFFENEFQNLTEILADLERYIKNREYE